jgi:hypothetical protein
MRLDSLCPILLIAVVACGGDDDDGTEDGSVADAGSMSDAGDVPPDGGENPDAGQDAAPDQDGGAAGDPCGGLLNLECDPLHYCEWKDDSCGQGDIQGTCMPRPSDCGMDPPAVCGCDGVRYDSACEAHRAGTDVAQVSVCGPGAP